MTTYPTPTRAQRRAWARKKANDRARAAYRNSLPQGIQVLTAMLENAPSQWHADIIQARIDTRREQYRRKNRARRAHREALERAEARNSHQGAY